MGDMVEKVAEALWLRTGSHSSWSDLAGALPKTAALYRDEASAALEACHHEELVEALEDIAAHWNGSENQTAMSDACHHNVEIARAVLAKVEASDA